MLMHGLSDFTVLPLYDHLHVTSLAAPSVSPWLSCQAEKALERIKEEGLIPKPFVAKKRSFTFPPVEKMGQKVGALVVLVGGPDGKGGDTHVTYTNQPVTQQSGGLCSWLSL
jgi:hypothetical protein